MWKIIENLHLEVNAMTFIGPGYSPKTPFLASQISSPLQSIKNLASNWLFCAILYYNNSTFIELIQVYRGRVNGFDENKVIISAINNLLKVLFGRGIDSNTFDEGHYLLIFGRICLYLYPGCLLIYSIYKQV